MSGGIKLRHRLGAALFRFGVHDDKLRASKEDSRNHQVAQGNHGRLAEPDSLTVHKPEESQDGARKSKACCFFEGSVNDTNGQGAETPSSK